MMGCMALNRVGDYAEYKTSCFTLADSQEPLDLLSSSAAVFFVICVAIVAQILHWKEPPARAAVGKAVEGLLQFRLLETFNF